MPASPGVLVCCVKCGERLFHGHAEMLGKEGRDVRWRHITDGTAMRRRIVRDHRGSFNLVDDHVATPAKDPLTTPR